MAVKLFSEMTENWELLEALAECDLRVVGVDFIRQTLLNSAAELKMYEDRPLHCPGCTCCD